MKQIQSEKHRLTTLQRQILKWIRLEGGDCLNVAQLFSTLCFSRTNPDAVMLGERLSEAVEQLSRSGYVEVRYENSEKSKFPSLYDLGGLHHNLIQKNDDSWEWNTQISGIQSPEVALSDFGSHYVAKMA